MRLNIRVVLHMGIKSVGTFFVFRRVLSFKYYIYIILYICPYIYLCINIHHHYNELNSPEYHLQWGNKDEDKPFAIHEKCKRERKKQGMKKRKSGLKPLEEPPDKRKPNPIRMRDI